MKKTRVFRTVIFLSGLLGWFIVGPGGASADITSFYTNPPNINNGQASVFVWTTSNASGAKLLLPCIRGIKYTNEGGGTLDCVNPITGLATNGTYTVNIININSLSTAVRAKLVTQDANGVYDESNPGYATVTVGPAPFVISEVAASPESVESQSYSTISWVGQYASGVNIMFTCADDVVITIDGDSRQSIPCGAFVFSND